jgi:hypothetical protein
VIVGVLNKDLAGGDWLASYEPSGGFDPTDYEAEASLNIGDGGARAWNFALEDFWGTEAAFYRRNIAVVVWADKGTDDEREIILNSVDEAVTDHIYGYE